LHDFFFFKFSTHTLIGIVVLLDNVNLVAYEGQLLTIQH